MQKKLKKSLWVSAAMCGLAAPLMANAAQVDVMACDVEITYSLNSVPSLTYVMSFQVAPDAPFSDDFSSATRFRFFDATMTVEAGDPVVSIRFDADVSVFNAVDFNASLKVRDRNKPETASGSNSFFSSLTGVAGAHRTEYTLTCQRARN